MFWSLVLLGVVAWLVLRKPKPTPQQLAAAEREARIENENLAEFTFDDPRAKSNYEHYNRHRFLFNAMGVQVTSLSTSSSPEAFRSYHLRRVDATKWQMKETAESIERQIAELNRLTAEDPESREANNEDIATLRSPAHWRDVSDDITGPLETRYQRYLLHYRGAD